MPDLARSIQIWPHMIPKLGLFDQATIDRVTTAYLAVEQHSEGLLLLGIRLVDPERAAFGDLQRQLERRAFSPSRRNNSARKVSRPGPRLARFPDAQAR
jgi:hypothetical protein